MAEKKSIQAPIDKPLARAYLREFTGWSTAYPPGLSDPTSLRTMENVYVTREGAVRIRPGIRSVFTKDTWLGNDGVSFIVGSFEHFIYDSSGAIALLFGVRQGSSVVFKVVVYNESTKRFDFVTVQAFTEVTFGAATTFIKYLQIDNKILALSDDPAEPAIIFYVGEVKSAKKVPAAGLNPSPNVNDPIILHPDAAWIDDTTKTTIPTAETPTPQTLVATFPTLGAAGSLTTASGQPFTLKGHGLGINQAVVIKGTTAPTGFNLNVQYYVRTVPSDDTFTLSSSAGSASIFPTSAGAGLYLEYGVQSDGSTAENPNIFSFGFFVTYETEFGEAQASDVTTIKTQRGWSQWKFNSPDSVGNPEETLVTNPELAMDQLVAVLPATKYDEWKSRGAIKWNLYMFTWNDTSAVPSVATWIGARDITAAGTDQTEGWLQCTAAPPADSYVVPVPSPSNRQNYSGGPTGRQGIAAGDRLTLVYDGNNQAVIKWASNVPGEYLNFSPSKGGGQKTLSSGNLLVPLNVQLWQNPQSVDTLTITCKGLNGYHSAYYMAPASVSGQSDSTLVMGFEQTTATPGTVSPYGVEVFNNKLYHPLEAELMASTAANYSISHKTMTTDIANKWQRLRDTQDIVSSQHDGRLYYVVHNPEGDTLHPGCMGNEVWVIDVGSENPTWSRWRIQGIALHKLQIGDKLYMALIRPDAIFIFDEMSYADEFADGATTLRRNIKWSIETNTLGANRQHDAWAYVHQAYVHVGDWIGGFEWGVRGFDVNAKLIEKKKRSHSVQGDTGLTTSDGLVKGDTDLGDVMDVLLVDKTMMEWTFFAQSIEDVPPAASAREVEPESIVWRFYGQIDFVQFMTAPASMNIGYERGSIETFEYQRNAYRGTYGGTDATRNGVPMPLDTRRP